MEIQTAGSAALQPRALHRRGSALKALIWVALLLGGCAPGTPIVEAPEGAVIVVTVVRDDKQLVAVSSGVTSLDDLSLREGSAAAVFVLNPDDFHDPNGQAKTAADLAAAEIVPAHQSTKPGTCSRCTVPHFGSDTSALVFPGDRCPLHQTAQMSFLGPDLERDALSDQELDEIRHLTELRWPGTCETEGTEDPLPRGEPLGLCPVLPEGSPEEWTRTALNDAGDLVAVGQNAILWSSPGAAAIVEAYDLPGVIHSLAPAFDGDGFFVVTSDYGNPGDSGARWTRIQNSGGRVLASPISDPADILAYEMQTLRGRSFIGGAIRRQIAGYVPAIITCQGLDCEPRRDIMTTSECTFGGRVSAIVDFADTPNGVVAVGYAGGLAMGSAQGPLDWHCLANEPADVSIAGLPVAFGVVRDAEALGNHIVACGATRDPNSVGVIATRSLEPTAEWTLTATVPVSCVSLARLPEGLFATYSGGAIRLDDQGRIAERIPFGTEEGLFAEMGRQGSSILTRGDHVVTTSDQNHSLYRTSPAFEVVRKTDYPTGDTVVARSTGHKLLVIRENAPSVEVDVGDDCASLQPTERDLRLDLPSSARLRGAVATEAGVLAYGSITEGRIVKRGLLVWTPTNGESTWTTTDETEVYDAALLSPQDLLVARGSSLGVFDTTSGQLSDVPVSFDDPRTEGTERSPEGDSFTVVEARHGVAWVGGERALTRVARASGGGYVGEAFFFGTYLAREVTRSTETAPPVMAALVVRQPSDLEVAIDMAADTTTWLNPFVSVFRLDANPTCEPISGDARFGACVHEDPSNDFERAEHASGLVEGPSGLILVGRNGRAVNFDSRRSYNLGIRPERTLDLSGDAFAVSDGYGAMAVLLPK